MPAGTYNIIIEKYSDYGRVFQVKENGNIVDISNYTFTAELKESVYETTGTSFSVENNDPTNGQFRIYLTDVQTAALSSGTQYYDVIQTDAAGNKTRLMEGEASIKEGVTRNV
jgi:hypothetical protein